MSFDKWIVGPERSVAIFHITGELLQAIRRLRKGLRDVRDREGRKNYRWRMVALGGLLDGKQNAVMVLVQHTGIARADVWDVLERRWPDVILTSVKNAVPSAALTVKDTAALAQRRRGIEPLRIVILPQRTSITVGAVDDALPMLL